MWKWTVDYKYEMLYTHKQVFKSIIFQDILSELSRLLHVYNAVDTDYPLDRIVCPIETRSTSHQRHIIIIIIQSQQWRAKKEM
jgi:hypothetical protein